MQYEYDPNKSAANKEKHGIDFEEAQALWGDERHLEAPTSLTEEPRYYVVGQIEGIHWTAIITYRGETTRIISVRRSRKNEVQHYEKANN